jgi:hypothetical protein
MEHMEKKANKFKKAREKHEKNEHKKEHKKEKKVFKEFGEGKLHSGSKKGPIVKNRKQAIAIALSEGRKSGEKIPKKKK